MLVVSCAAAGIAVDEALLGGPSETVIIDIILDEAPDGISGYNITAEIIDASIAEILAVEYPSWVTISENSTLPSDHCWMMAVDLSSQVESGSTDILLATITLRGDTPGTTNFLVSPVQIDDDFGGLVIADPVESLITVNGSSPPPTNATFEVTLESGWSPFSTPVALKAGNAKLMEIFNPVSQENIMLVLSWDGNQWFIPGGNYQMSPLYAVYVKVREGSTATAVLNPDDGISSLPQRSLSSGISLIGPAPAYDSDMGVFPAMPLDQALISIQEAPGGLVGYIIVVSPSNGQTGWSYGLGGQVQNMLPFEGYWVVMENPDTFYGFSTTPI